MNLKKVLKIILGAIIFITLPSLMLYGFLYFKYNESIPQGQAGEKADALAYKMLDALNHDAFTNTDYIEWTYQKRRHYRWHKDKQTCDVYWKEYRVTLNFKDHEKHKAFVHGFTVDGEMAKDIISKGFKHFKNDSFWLVAPHKVFDDGVKRELVENEGNSHLLVTYRDNSVISDATYLWMLDGSGKPISCKMWTSKLPIDGLEATWNHWKTTESGAKFPTFHKVMFFGFEIDGLKATKSL